MKIALLARVNTHRRHGLDRAQVLRALERFGHARLAPVYEALSKAVPYAELHLLRLYLVCRDHQ